MSVEVKLEVTIEVNSDYEVDEYLAGLSGDVDDVDEVREGMYSVVDGAINESLGDLLVARGIVNIEVPTTSVEEAVDEYVNRLEISWSLDNSN